MKERVKENWIRGGSKSRKKERKKERKRSKWETERKKE